jgi:hypothetical protein
VPSTLGGIWRAVERQFTAQAEVAFAWTEAGIDTQDTTSNTYLQASNNETLGGENYNFKWSDPTDDIINMAHELTLRTAIATTSTLVITNKNSQDLGTADLLTKGQPEIVSPDLTLVNRTLDQEAQVAITFDETVYKAQPEWLAAAFVLIVVACLSILPTYWGWWRLGRPVSMSPLEIAKAFEAPLMQHADPNGTIDDHLQSVGSTRVRYGFHANGAEQAENDTTQCPSFPSKVGSTVNISVIDQSSSDNVSVALRRPLSKDGSTSGTPTARPAGPDETSQLGDLLCDASPASEAQSDRLTTGRDITCSNACKSDLGLQVDPASSQTLGARPATSCMHSRTKMQLRFARE